MERLGGHTGSGAFARRRDGPADLAHNRPGALVRARAQELRRQAPIWTLVARVLGIHTDERDFRVGAAGEAVVARRLRALRGSGWRVIHSVPVGTKGSDIDHLVIGPPGVFCLNTKHHPGGQVWVGRDDVLVNGRPTPYVRNARFEATRSSRALGAACGFPVAVRPAIVVVCARLTVRVQPRRVHVVDDRSLVRWLAGERPVLGPAELDAIFDRARRAATWRAARR